MVRRVMVFGDSNTWGSDARGGNGGRYPRGVRWPTVLAGELGDGWEVVEEGQPGRTTVHDDPFEGAHRNGLTVLPALLESHCPLDLVVILLGTNDLKHRFGLSPDDIARGAERLAKLVRASDELPAGGAPDVLLVAPGRVALVGELGDMFAGATGKQPDLYEAYRRAGARIGVPVMDASPHAEVDMTDGIHLTETGQQALGRAVATEIRRLWP